MQMNEILSVANVLPVLQTAADQLQSLISAKEKALKKAPAGRLRLSRRKNQVQWFHVTKGTTVHGKYIPVNEIGRAKALAQKEYDQKALPELKKWRFLIDSFLNRFRLQNLENLYACMHEGRQKLVTPVYESDETYIAQWLAGVYEGKKIEDDVPEIMTLRGERVRSKSEAMIADTLYRLKIPYKYECPLAIRHKKGTSRNTMTVYPDFTCLNVRLRQEFVWEHFGMMDDADYSSQVAWKVTCFEGNGYFLGKNLIVSMESSEIPLDATRIEKIAMQYLL